MNQRARLASAARRVAFGLWAVGSAAGCTAANSTMTGPAMSAPTISDLTVTPGGNQTVIFRVTAMDPDADIVGGTCIIHAAGFDMSAPIVGPTGTPTNATAAVVACTVDVTPDASGTLISGTLSITDVRGNPSNHLAFTTTLPERLTSAR